MTPKPQPNPAFILPSNMLIGMGLGFVFTAMTMHQHRFLWLTLALLAAGIVGHIIGFTEFHKARTRWFQEGGD